MRAPFTVSRCHGRYRLNLSDANGVLRWAGRFDTKAEAEAQGRTGQPKPPRPLLKGDDRPTMDTINYPGVCWNRDHRIWQLNGLDGKFLKSYTLQAEAIEERKRLETAQRWVKPISVDDYVMIRRKDNPKIYHNRPLNEALKWLVEGGYYETEDLALAALTLGTVETPSYTYTAI